MDKYKVMSLIREDIKKVKATYEHDCKRHENDNRYAAPSYSEFSAAVGALRKALGYVGMIDTEKNR